MFICKIDEPLILSISDRGKKISMKLLLRLCPCYAKLALRTFRRWEIGLERDSSVERVVQVKMRL